MFPFSNAIVMTLSRKLRSIRDQLRCLKPFKNTINHSFMEFYFGDKKKEGKLTHSEAHKEENRTSSDAKNHFYTVNFPFNRLTS
jgi:hypothetical protein